MTKTILIIDDDINDREALRRILESKAYHVIDAETGEEGIQMAQDQKPDIVIIDTQMTTIDGFETCRCIKQIKDLNTKVIVITGQIDAIDATKARSMGADDYCVKTTTHAPILTAITTL